MWRHTCTIWIAPSVISQRSGGERSFSEIEEHIADMLAELPSDAGEAAVLNALDRVGDPDDIAKEARDRFGITRGRPSWSDPLAIVLLLV
jgi:hypothetical protein